jgi:hypothetical protein
MQEAQWFDADESPYRHERLAKEERERERAELGIQLERAIAEDHARRDREARR